MPSALGSGTRWDAERFPSAQESPRVSLGKDFEMFHQLPTEPMIRDIMRTGEIKTNKENKKIHGGKRLIENIAGLEPISQMSL